MPDPTRPTGEPRRPTLDELLDRADPGAAAEIQRLAAASESARRQVEAHTQSEAVLRRLFAEPETVIVNLPASGGRSRRWTIWTAAAAAILVLVGGWRIYSISSRPDVLGPLYRQTLAAGFEPEVVCTTPEAFSEWTRGNLRQALYPGVGDEPIEYLGWNRSTTVGPYTGVLLAKVGGDPIIVVLVQSDRQTVVPGSVADPTLHKFSRTVGKLVLYEITPREKAAVLPALSEYPAR